MTEYPPSGSLFEARNKKSEKSPDYTGYMELSHEVVDDLIKQKNEGISKPKFNLVGWKKMGLKSGKAFLSIRSNVFEEYNANKTQGNSFGSNNNNTINSNTSAIASTIDDDEIPF